MSSVAHTIDAWALTCALTPRQAVRELDGGDARSRRGLATAPNRPWAMYLARKIGRTYATRYLGFDFDAKNGHDYEAVLLDVAELTSILDRLAIAHLVCRSSEHGGIHVWVAMSEDLSPATAAKIAQLAKILMPSLDTAPLSNPAAGCLRPPYAPHHSGSRSEPIAGTITTLLEPSTSVDDALALLDALRAAQPAPAPVVPSAATLVGAVRAPQSAAETHGRLPVDADGHVFLPGARRPLPAAAAAALRTPVALLDDASKILATILCGAARAHWRYADVAALVDVEPGLERARTVRAGDLRIPRPTTGALSPAALLRAEWQRAVRHVASTGTSGVGDDPTFTDRLSATTAIADAVQQRADAMPGRWSHDGGPADRRILDRLTLYALAAVSAVVEADVRRLALDTGMGRETARTALLRLQTDGWIAKAGDADGPRGARWLIDPRNVLHSNLDQGRSQAATAAARRLHLLDVLRLRATHAAHDVFTYGALGIHTGNLYARLLEHGHLPRSHDRGIRRLLQHGLAHAHGSRIQPGTDRRVQIARALDVAGRLELRAARYRFEREVWAWWNAELDWMQSKGRSRTARRSTAPVLWHSRGADHYPAMPRHGGRVRFDLARSQTAAGLLTAPMLAPDVERIAA